MALQGSHPTSHAPEYQVRAKLLAYVRDHGQGYLDSLSLNLFIHKLRIRNLRKEE